MRGPVAARVEPPPLHARPHTVHGTGRQVNEAALMRARAYATRRLLLRGAAGFGIGYAAGSRER